MASGSYSWEMNRAIASAITCRASMAVPPRAITPENVSFNNTDPVAISPDGKSVAVAGLDGKIMLYPLDNGAPRAVPKLADGFAPLRWCPGDSLMVYRQEKCPRKSFGGRRHRRAGSLEGVIAGQSIWTRQHRLHKGGCRLSEFGIFSHIFSFGTVDRHRPALRSLWAPGMKTSAKGSLLTP